MTPYRKLRHGTREGGYRRFTAATPPSTLLDGLVSYWALDETSGTRVDAVGDNDLTDNNTVGYGTGKNGDAAVFVRGNAETLSGGAALDAAADYTASLWVNITSGVGGWLFFLSAETTNYEDSPLLIQFNNDGGAGLYALGHTAGGPDPIIVVSTASVPVDEWCHLIVTWDVSERTMEFFLNNISKGSDAAAAAQIAPSPTHFYLGGSASPGQYASCLIDETTIWSRVLTEDERAELYNGGSGKFYPFT